jgi:hypothetical protein
MSDVHFRLIKSEHMPLTKPLAEQFRCMRASPTERELDEGHVKHLHEKFVAGHAVPFYWVTAILNGVEVRMNGNHSSNALCQLNGAFPEGLMVHRDTFEVPNEDSLALLFRQFDDRKSGRSKEDVSGAYQGLYEPLRDVPRWIAKLGAEGIAWHERFAMQVSVPIGDDIYTLFADPKYHTFLRWLGETLTVKTPEMRKASVVATMYGTFVANEPAAREFWSSVARGGVEFDDNAPATVLDTWLKQQKDKKKKLGLTPAQFWQGCAYCWTAFRDAKSLKDVKYDTSKGLHPIQH